MKIVEIKVKCGWPSCPTVALQGEGLVVTRTVAIDGSPHEIDICKPHSDDLNEILAPLIADGRKAEPTVAQKKGSGTKPRSSKYPELTVDDLTCKIAGCKMDRPCKNAAGLAQHVQRGHGLDGLEEYFVLYPPTADRSTG